MAGKLYLYFPEAGNAKEMGDTGRWFSYGWDRLLRQGRNVPFDWFDALAWYGSHQCRIHHHLPGGVGRTITSRIGRDKVRQHMDLDAWPRARNALKRNPHKRLQRLVDDYSDTVGAFIWDNDVDMSVYMGNFRRPVWPKTIIPGPDSEDYLLWLKSVLPYIEAGCTRFTYDNLTRDVVLGACYAMAANHAKSMPGRVFGERTPLRGPQAEQWAKDGIGFTMTTTPIDMRTGVIPAKFPQVKWAHQHGVEYMILPMTNLPRSRQSVVDLMKRWLELGYDVAIPARYVSHLDYARVFKPFEREI